MNDVWERNVADDTLNDRQVTNLLDDDEMKNLNSLISPLSPQSIGYKNPLNTGI